MAVAAYAVFIAGKQARIAKEKLALDFFDKRFDAYRDLIDVGFALFGAVNALKPDHKTIREAWDRFQRAFDVAEVIFGKDVQAELALMSDRISELRHANERRIAEIRANQPENPPGAYRRAFDEAAAQFERVTDAMKTYFLLPEQVGWTSFPKRLKRP